ncbi:hypothetical protein HNQ81_000893 [Desulfoprunum benzoelyticum]|uniref:Uncharacterized protein n=1 Tax=Desulfoprunum benzoelyticum TaxID=1506996 RepID=A0A840V043_9BACT|nr:hypothetical protein [Desulfoprunum benzoelyticum]
MQGKKDQEDVLKLSFEDDPRVRWIPPEEWPKQGRSLNRD